MKLACLFSGGKDSSYACFLAKKKHDVAFLVSVFSENSESFMYHTPNIGLTQLQAELAGISHVVVHSKGEKEKELADLEQALSLLPVDGVVTGAVASTYQKKRVDDICRKLGLKHVAPLWGKNPAALVKAQVEAGFEAIIVAVAAEGFDESWLGRSIDKDCLEDLKKLNRKYGISVSGEGGEYESTVLACPLFSRRIVVKRAKKVWENDRGFLSVKETGLA